MSAPFNRSQHRTRRLSVAVKFGPLSFPIELCSRTLDLASGTSADYYWIDTSKFHVPRTKRAPDFSLFENIVAHQWEAMRRMRSTDEEQLRMLLLAACYPLVSNDKSCQRVYRDAQLGSRRVDPQASSLVHETREQIHQVVQRRDWNLLRNELDVALGMPTLTASEAFQMTEILEKILDHGVGLVRENGDAGFALFTNMMDQWITNYRRRGHDEFKQALINHLSYQFKISFYTCYANLWVSLIPLLKSRIGLSSVSERFLRFWHMQNQPVSLPGGGFVPSVFCGQILALHPLSGFFMKDSALLAIAGRFFGSKAHHRVFVKGEAAACDKYWDLLGAILTAAHLYRQAANHYQDKRSTAPRNYQGPSTVRGQRRVTAGSQPVASNADPMNAAGMMDDLARGQGWFCPHCHAELRFLDHTLNVDRDRADLQFQCTLCKKSIRRHLGFDEMREALHPTAN